MRIYKDFLFEAAHYLPSAPPGHPNSRVHGHSFRARIIIDVEPDPEPGKGYFFRSNQFEFAKVGVPALYLEAGTQFLGKDPSFAKSKREEYVAKDYHKPSDEVKPDWDLSGAVDDTRALFEVGYRVTMATTWPTWKAGTESKARRDSALATPK